MSTEFKPATRPTTAAPAPGHAQLPPWPAGSQILQIAFVPHAESGQPVLHTLPMSLGKVAVELPADSAAHTPPALSLLCIPHTPSDLQPGGDPDLVPRIQQWVDGGNSTGEPTLLMTFQGTQLAWCRGRCALIAAPDRLESLRKSLLEVAYYEAELHAIEHALSESWPALEADTPQAFEFNEASLSQKKALQKRFQHVLELRARLARLGPMVHTPHLHPPTLASQLNERLRERARLEHRYEFLDEQIEVFENVYEMCSERASDFTLTRSGNLLEWVIIVLLFTQIILSTFEILTGLSSTPAAPISPATQVPASVSAETPAASAVGK